MTPRTSGQGIVDELTASDESDVGQGQIDPSGDDGAVGKVDDNSPRGADSDNDDLDGAISGHVPELDVSADAPSDSDDQKWNWSVRRGTRSPRPTNRRLLVSVGTVLVVALTALTGWLGFGVYQANQAQQQRELFLQVARQAALNLTTIDWQQADTDVQRILDTATGPFYDDFQQRAGAFTEVVKQAQSVSVGSILAAGIESESDNEAQVLVALSMTTSNVGAADQPPRDWKMRISVQRVGNDAKVSNVAFVP